MILDDPVAIIRSIKLGKIKKEKEMKGLEFGL